MSTKSTAVRKNRTNAKKLGDYLRENDATTVSAIVRERLMNSREASEALQYAVRHGVIASEKRLGATSDEPVTYTLTGRPLTATKESSFSFDALFIACGICCNPPQSECPPADRRIIGSHAIQDPRLVRRVYRRRWPTCSRYTHCR